jgi:hypothetical protein
MHTYVRMYMYSYLHTHTHTHFIRVSGDSPCTTNQ